MWLPEFREKIKQNGKLGNLKAQINNPNGTFFEKSHSEETKKIIGNKNSITQSGKGNSQFGSMWITNGVESKKIKKDYTIQEGWYKGRKLKRV